ncbi:MAG: protein-export chaperone SecB [Prevotella sp.]|nr:protein-export chaperone SecB [Prevotella sp.]
MEKETAIFRFLDYRIIKSLIELHPENGETSSKLSVSLGVPENINISGNNITYPMNVSIQDENNVLNIEVNIVGNFEIDKDTEDLQSFIEINAPAILFPYIRAHITTITSLSGIKPVILPTLNMTKNK